MKRIVLLLLVFMLIATPVLANEMPAAIYTLVKQDIYPDNIGKFNYLSTLRMTFPDICFKINNEMRAEILNGEQYEFVDIERLHFLYGTGLYLFPYQVRAISHQYRILGLPDPEVEALIETKNPTPAQKHLFKYYMQYYREQGFLQLLE